MPDSIPGPQKKVQLTDLTDDATIQASGALDVHIVSGSSGTSMTDDAAFTPATSSITPAGFLFDDTGPDSVDEGDAGIGRMSANRNQYVTIRDAAGNERGLNVDASGQIAITHAALTELAAAIDTEVQVDVVGALPAGTNAIGKLAANDGVDIGDVTINGPVGAGTEAGAVRVTLATDSTGLVSVDDNGGSLTVDNTVLSVVGGGVEATAQRVTIASDSTGVLSVDDNGGALTVDNAGTFAVQDSAAEASLSVMDDWDNAASDGASVSGDVAHDAADAGEPVKVGFKAYSPDGTTPGTAVAELDRTNGKADLDGIQYVQTMNPQNFSYHDDDAAAVTTDGTVKADPGDGFAVFITDIVFSIGAATASSIFLEEGSTKILGPYYLEAIAGRGLSIHFNTPKRCTASTAILVTNTGSILFSIDILGFVAAV